jgi:geranylgeranylglycerol-phosphate geranylgeranyltransferase
VEQEGANSFHSRFSLSQQKRGSKICKYGKSQSRREKPLNKQHKNSLWLWIPESHIPPTKQFINHTGQKQYMFGYIELLRPVNCLMASFAVFIGGLLIASSSPALLLAPAIYIAMIAAFLITGGGNAINDYVDVDADKINRPKRPIPSGRVPRKSALVYAFLLFFTGIFLAGFINYIVFFIAFFNSFVLIIYSVYLQDKILLGNIAVSYMVGSTFLFGGAVFNELLLPLILMLLAFFANFSREIVKDLEDIEGDKRSFFKKLTHRIKVSAESAAHRFILKDGKVSVNFERRKSVFAATASLALAVLLSPLPYVLGILSYLYIYIVIVADAFFIYSAFLIVTGKNRKMYARISKMIKIGMFLGLLAFILGAF